MSWVCSSKDVVCGGPLPFRGFLQQSPPRTKICVLLCVSRVVMCVCVRFRFCGRFLFLLSVRAHATAFVVKAEKGYLLTAAHTFLQYKLGKSDDGGGGGSDDGDGDGAASRQGGWDYYDGVTDENCIVLVSKA